MAREQYSRFELVTLYNNWKESIERDQAELKARHFDEWGDAIDPQDPDVNRFAGKIAGQVELLLDFAALLETEQVPDTIEGIDKA